MLITYCETCGRRISDAELANGQTTKLEDNKAICAECSAAQVPVPAAAPVRSAATGKSPPRGSAPNPSFRASPASGAEVPLPALNIGSSTAHVAAVRKGTGTRKTTAHHDHVRGSAHASGAQPATDNSGFMILGIVGSILIMGGLYFAFAGGGPKKNSDDAKITAQAEPQTPVQEPKRPSEPAAAPVRPAPESTNDARKSEPPQTAEPLKAKPESDPDVTPPKAASTPGKDDDDMVSYRNDLAAGKLKEALAFVQQNPNEAWGYKAKLDGIISSYRSTPAGIEAAKLLAELKLPERPAAPVSTVSNAVTHAPAGAATATPTATGDWKLVIGKSINTLNPMSQNAWRMNGDDIENIPGIENSGQSSQEYGDGEYRVRFVSEGAGMVFFGFRQGGGGVDSVRFSGVSLKSINDGKPHELICICRASSCSAKLDGKAITMNSEGSARQGRIQFNAREGKLKLRSIEWRKLSD